MAIQHIQELLPFPILGIDTDNGSEFINEDLFEFCRTKQITFTRGRVHRKNDQCFVEQKNGSIVRQLVGYDRYDGLLAMRQLSELYRALRLYVNFYQPSMKLKTKTRDGAKVHRTYSPAQTPLQRLFVSGMLPESTQDRLDQLRKSLDPVMLLRLLQTLQDAFWRYATVAAPEEWSWGPKSSQWPLNLVPASQPMNVHPQQANLQSSLAEDIDGLRNQGNRGPTGHAETLSKRSTQTCTSGLWRPREPRQ